MGIKFLLSVFLGVAIVSTLYSYERQSLNFSSFDQVGDEFENIYILMQKKQHKIFDRTPNVNELQNGEIVGYKSGTTVKLYLRVSQSTYSVTLTN